MRITRRSFLAATGVGVATVAVGCRSTSTGGPDRGQTAFSVPLDTVPHVRTWMAWPSDVAIWGGWLAAVQQEIGLIAATIARFEPVTLCATDPDAANQARAACGTGVTVIDSIPVNDCWMRDAGPVFRSDSRRRDAAGLNFNGWGSKQRHDKDRSVAESVAREAGAPFSAAGFVGEGGAIETDGDGTVMATESSLVNPERNPGMTRSQVEAAVLEAYGAQKMLWLPGIADRDITDDHVDATSRFVRPGVVMVQRPPAVRTDIWAEDERVQLALLSRITDAKGRRLRVIVVDGPDTVRSNDPGFVDSYVNYYACNGAVIMPEFGDVAKDQAARATVGAALPGRTVVALNYDTIALGGGGVHCVTQQEPAR
jgi:agmatine deiminase